MNPFEKLVSELKRLESGYREESYYRPLCDFLEEYAGMREYLHMINVKATNNPSSESVGEHVGFPDIEVRQNRRLIGYLEVKTPNQNLDNPAFLNQFNKYKESLENIIFTNFKKWVLYTWDNEGKPKKTDEVEWDFSSDISAEKLKRLLTVFFEGQAYEAKTPHQLALALARKTKLLSQQVQEALTGEIPDNKLVDLKKTFEKTLIQNISDHQFANIYAETIAYSLFLAMLQHFEKGSKDDFTLRTAVDYLPSNVPIFKDLYQLTGGRVDPITPEIYNATEILIEQLNFSDIERIYKKLIEHKPGEDPVIQFYEPFLAEYDPKEREARGVYYTPKPVVDYIVRSLDYILKTKFNKTKGLGDESVQVLDPATGTGTFLMSVIQNIYADIDKENRPLGEEAVNRKFREVVINHILKHLYGFELLVAPYAIAHLKLTIELERLGFEFNMTAKDQDHDNDRLKVYLANTLDDPEKPPMSLFGFESITEESEKARIVKKDNPILIITGNPPYSNFGQMNKGKWILGLLEDYKKDLNEKKINLDDDFIKFIRFAQWKLEKTGQGIFAMITNNTFIDGITHRQMRRSLLDTFDEIYILNLHGNNRKGEVAPNGGKDENVFDIQLGVSINIFIKYSEKNRETEVNINDLWGLREFKFSTLMDTGFEKTIWQKIKPQIPNWFFTKRDNNIQAEYDKYSPLRDIFIKSGSGIITRNDEITVQFDKELIIELLNDFNMLGENEIRQKYNIKDGANWKLIKAISDVRESRPTSIISPISYHPFDIRYTYLTDRSGGFLNRPIYDTMKHMKHNNLGLSTKRSHQYKDLNFLVTKFISNTRYSSKTGSIGGDYLYPIYLYNEDENVQLPLSNNTNEHLNCIPNLNTTFIKNFSTNVDLKFIPNGVGDLRTTFGPEALFYYSYSIFYSHTYCSRYIEQLNIDFPRLPVTNNKELFKRLVQKGNELVNLHLLGKNPFDKSKTIFDETSQWHVQIGGEKPENFDDWKVTEVRYDEITKRIFVNPKQYFEGIEKKVWEFVIGGYPVLYKWLNDRKKGGRVLSYDDQIHYMKIIVSLRETIRIMKEIDEAIPEWPIK